jgi:quinol monooxygenase YgiN
MGVPASVISAPEWPTNEPVAKGPEQGALKAKSENKSTEKIAMSDERIGFIVHFQLKPGHEEEWRSSARGVLDAMLEEHAFVNFFQLQDKTVPTRFVLYETWNCTKEDFVNVQMKRSYRQRYEQTLPPLLVKPREMQLNWHLIHSESKHLDQLAANQEQLAFFVYFQTKPAKEDRFRSTLDALLDAMSKEESFINYFLLQDETDSTKFVIFETWRGTEEEVRNVQMKRPYRLSYEESLPELLAKPREVQLNWRLLRSEIKRKEVSSTRLTTR